MANEERRRSTGKTDRDLQGDVLCELAWDNRTSDKHVGVQVDEGVVTLGGTVEDLATRNAAAEVAHQVAGVKDVANEIQVPSTLGAHLTDTDIAKAVRHALEGDALLPDKEIRSTVGEGIVALDGIVTTPIEREEAERIVARLKGVKHVENRLHVRRMSEPDAIEASIRQALNRRAVREAAGVVVRVDGGQVTVEGTVQSAEERSAVLGAVRGTGGVQTIEDRLRVESQIRSRGDQSTNEPRSGRHKRRTPDDLTK
jgi:osmotically-inducible protein OsmY